MSPLSISYGLESQCELIGSSTEGIRYCLSLRISGERDDSCGHCDRKSEEGFFHRLFYLLMVVDVVTTGANL